MLRASIKQQVTAESEINQAILERLTSIEESINSCRVEISRIESKTIGPPTLSLKQLAKPKFVKPEEGYGELGIGGREPLWLGSEETFDRPRFPSSGFNFSKIPDIPELPTPPPIIENASARTQERITS